MFVNRNTFLFLMIVAQNLLRIIKWFIPEFFTVRKYANRISLRFRQSWLIKNTIATSKQGFNFAGLVW